MLVRDPSPFAPILLGTFAPSTDGLLIGFVVPSGSRPAEKTLDLPVSGTWNWGVLASKSIGPYFAITVRVNKGEPGGGLRPGFRERQDRKSPLLFVAIRFEVLIITNAARLGG